MPEALTPPAVGETLNTAIIDVPRNGRKTPTERQSVPVQAQPAAEPPKDGAPPLAASVAVTEPETPKVSEPPKTSEENLPQAAPPQSQPSAQPKDWRVAQPAPGQPIAEDPKPGEPPQPQPGVRDHRIDGYYALQRRVRELEAQQGQPAQPPAQPQASPAPPTATPPAPAGKPTWVPEKYADRGGYDAFVEDLADWRADQKIEAKLQERDRQQADAFAQDAARKAIATWEQKIATANIPDYTEVLRGAGNVPMKQAILEQMLTMEVGPHLFYHFAKNPDEAARMLSLPLHRQFAELAKLEEQYSSPPSVPKVDVPPVQSPLPTGASTAPAPIKPLRPTVQNLPDDPAKIAGASAENDDFRRYAAAAGIEVQKGRFGARRG